MPLETKDFKLLWISNALASGVGVVVTLLAGAGAIARAGVVGLCVFGSVFFVSTLVGLNWIHIERPIRAKSYILSISVLLMMSALGWYAWPRPSNESAQLDRIERLLALHGAIIHRSRIEPATEVVFNGTPTGRYMWLYPGKPIVMNLFFTNTGAIAADEEQPTCGRAYLSPLNPLIASHKEWSDELTRLQAKFEEYEAMCKQNLKPGGAIDPGGGEIMISATTEESVGQFDINALKNGYETVLLFASITYSDPTGQHYQHYCNWVQSPAFDPPMFDQCGVFNDHR